MRNFIILLCIATVVLGGGCSKEDIQFEEVTKFSTDNKGDYLLFHFINPFEKEGYIAEVSNDGKLIQKYIITDTHFAPSNVFHFDDNFYFASAAYSSDKKIMKYNPEKRRLSLFDTNQDKFIDRYYRDDQSEYITNLIDNNSRNEFCDINLKKCIGSSDEYMVFEVTTIDNYVIVVEIPGPRNTKEKIIKIKKFDRKLEFLEEVTLDQYPNYFTYTSSDQKLHLFMTNGNIVRVDSDLNIDSFPLHLNIFSKDIGRVEYKKNVMIGPDRILVGIKLEVNGKITELLAEISFKNDGPVVKVIEEDTDEDVINVDYDSGEVFTRSYVNKKTVISIRDTTNLKLKNQFILMNNDPIYFVDNIK